MNNLIMLSILYGLRRFPVLQRRSALQHFD